MPFSNQVELTVANPPSPTQLYAAAGATAVSIFIESPLAIGVTPRVRRLTHSDQISKYPSDQGFKFLNGIQGKQWVFFTRNTLRRGGGG
jgi:hypothetical protein